VNIRKAKASSEARRFRPRPRFRWPSAKRFATGRDYKRVKLDRGCVEDQPQRVAMVRLENSTRPACSTRCGWCSAHSRESSSRLTRF